MELKDLKELIKLIDDSKITEFQLDKDNFKVLIKKEKEEFKVFNSGDAAITSNMPTESFLREIREESAPVEEKEDKNVHTINSPIIGMFYSAPAPDSPNFVKIGDRIKKGDVLCIIEAMKLMNEVTSDIDGEIVEVLVENKCVVEYGEPLFKVRTV